MRKRSIAAIAGLLALGFAGAAMAQEEPDEDDLPAAEAQAPGVRANLQPGYDDMMTMLVQPRHIKLWLAAHEENWALAEFQLNELQHAFDRIAAALPMYRNFNLSQTTRAMTQREMLSLRQAIAAQSKSQFDPAFNALTQACNSCHEAMGHPYLVMKAPQANPFVDQRFAPVEGE